VVRAVAAFIALYTMLLGFSAMALAWLGADLISAFTAAAATLGNVGPALGMAGPMASYADFHPLSRGLLIFNMYAGRLEVVTVFVLATSAWWKVPRGMWRVSESDRARDR
jgi:trk system potassium uptake protein TrkH